MNHISFPSIDQFRTAIKHVRDNAKYHSLPVPSVKFHGTVKMHGTNAAVCIDANNEIWCQSRERVITPTDDNAGFAMFVHGKREFFRFLLNTIQDKTASSNVQVYGEWCGGNVQKGVGLSKLPKMFVVFGIQLGAEGKWLRVADLKEIFSSVTEEGVYCSEQFQTYDITIDMNNPEIAQNELVRITEEVEKCCPVAKALIGETTDELVGEGVVWTAVEAIDSTLNLLDVRFKVKGEKHSVSKVRTVAAIDIEKVNSINEFVEKTVTKNRLEQGIDKLREKGLDVDPKNTGEYIKWVVGDVLKEELDTLEASGLTTKDITSKIATVARQFFMGQ